MKRLVAPVLLFSIWLIMNENISIITLVLGVLVTAASLLLTNQLLDFRYTQVFFLPPLKLLRYLFFLLKEIYQNGIRATAMIISGKVQPCFITFSINEKIKNPFIHNILATSITLTPGTITVENQEGLFTVLSMHTDETKPDEAFEPFMLDLE